MKKLLLLITALILTTFISFSQWAQISPYPTNNILYDVSFSDDNNGLAVGSVGTIIRTVDGGENWLVIETGIKQYLYDVCYLDSEIAFVVGEEGTLLKTTDGGVNWVNQALPDSINLRSISFADTLLGWIACQYNHHGYIFHTQNGGETWALQNTVQENQLNSICFINETKGWVAGSHGIIHTADGGMTWNPQFTGDWSNLTHISFLDSLTGWSVGNGAGALILHTIDGGENWLSDTTELTESGSLNEIIFINEQHGFIVGDANNMGNSYGFMLKTTNGGEEWVNASCPVFASMNGLCFIGEEEGWAVGSHGNIVHTYDGGNEWVQMSGKMNDVMLDDIFFTDKYNGWLIGNIPYLYEVSRIYKTSDGGLNWEIIDSYFSSWLEDVFFIDENIGWLCGMGLHKTIDGGVTWDYPIYPYTGYHCNDLLFTDMQNGWLADYSIHVSKIYHTADGGENWDVQYEAIDSHIDQFYFIDQNTGWALGMQFDDIGYYGGFILSTTNAGNTWTEQLTADFLSFLSIYFADNNNGVIITANGRVLKTSNGGNIWEEMSSGIADTCTDAYFIDMETVWMVGRDGKIFHSTDAGVNWAEQESNTDSDLTKVRFTNSENGYILGKNSTLLQTNNGGISWISDPVTIIPFYLECYPNPNSGALHLRYQIQDTKYQKCELFSMDGLLVKTLVSVMQQAGKYEHTFDVSDLPNGLYLIRLQAGTNSETSKIIIHK